MNDEIFFIRLRDCFNAGYTIPQFCLDNEIKNPLFVAANENHLSMLWEIYTQFAYSKIVEIQPQYVFIGRQIESLSFSVYSIIAPMKLLTLSDVDVSSIDRIVLLTANRINMNISVPIIQLPELVNYSVQRTYAEIPLLHFIERNPEVKLILTNFPNQPRHDDAEFERKILSIAEFKSKISTDPEFKTPLDRFGYTKADILAITEAPDVITNPDGSTSMIDDDNPLVNIKNGRRMTAYQPDNYRNKIYFVGSCHHYGVHAPYDKTIASYLQKLLNKHNLPYRVENESQRFFNRQQDTFYNLNNLKPESGDIIFVWINNLIAKNIPFFNLGNIFDEPNDYREIFVTNGHVNEIGYRIVADKMFNMLMQNNFFKGVNFNYPAPPPPPRRYGIPHEIPISTASGELENYKHTLRAKRLPIGAIVMNCNPFTLGHEYLVEYAAKKVARLYVFVVEEDKSEFAFADRFKLVKAGVKKFSNVEVIPSGKFIISQQTFSGYFNKTELQNAVVDSSEDVEIFAREIAPVLGINIRFAGEEPEDAVTRQYNETMKIIMPRYGIDFREIPRRKVGDNVISAKAVRDALKVGDFDKIRKLVPRTTMNFLREKFTPPHYKFVAFYRSFDSICPKYVLININPVVFGTRRKNSFQLIGGFQHG